MRSRWLRVGLPIGAIAVITAAGIGYYNWRITGDPLLLPQTLNRNTYAVAPYFIWESERPQPAYNHETMREFYTLWEVRYQKADEQDTLDGWLESARERFPGLWGFFIGNALSVAILLLPLALRDRRMRFWIYAMPCFAVGLLLARFTQAHYVAPMIAGLYVLIMQSMRHLRYLHIGIPHAGLWLVRVIVLASIASFAYKTVTAPTGVDQSLYRKFDRANLEDRLEHAGGKQLVIVRYGNPEVLGQEWVYNHAKIDQAAVVWAREMADPVDNLDLQAYFHDRTCWILEPDKDQSALTPCPALHRP
jgi:hypothetical protein